MNREGCLVNEKQKAIERARWHVQQAVGILDLNCCIDIDLACDRVIEDDLYVAMDYAVALLRAPCPVNHPISHLVDDIVLDLDRAIKRDRILSLAPEIPLSLPPHLDLAHHHLDDCIREIEKALVAPGGFMTNHSAEGLVKELVPAKGGAALTPLGERYGRRVLNRVLPAEFHRESLGDLEEELAALRAARITRMRLSIYFWLQVLEETLDCGFRHFRALVRKLGLKSAFDILLEAKERLTGNR